MDNKVSQKLARDKARDLVSNLDSSVFSDLTSELQAKRRIAVENILSSLDPLNQSIDNIVLQYIPFELRSKLGSLHEIAFLEQCLRNRALIDPKVLSNSIVTASEKIELYRNEGDNETLELIQSTLVVLRKILLNHPHYKDDPQTHIHFGIEFENDNKPQEAILQYQKAIDLGSIDGYLYLSTLYEKLQNYDLSTQTSLQGFELTQDPIFLHGYIRGLCRSGKSQEAFSVYKIFAKVFRTTDFLPFIFYLGRIETDEQLYELEEYMIAFQGGNSLIIEEAVIQLAKEASIYINQQVERENQILAEFNNKAGLLDERDIVACQASIKRRLFLMQFHLVVLQNGYYLERYVDELTKYSISGTHDSRAMLDDYFACYFSVTVFEKYVEDSSISRHTDYGQFGGLESIGIHIDHIAEVFRQIEYYNIIRDKIIPLELELNEILSVEDSQEMIEGFQEALEILNNKKEHFDSLPKDVMRSYVIFMNGLSSRYGSYFVRNIQTSIRYMSDDQEVKLSHSILSLKKPEISLLYLIESIIGLQLSIESIHAFELFSAEHNLDTLDINQTSLLISIASAYGYHDLVIQIVINYPGKILDKPNILSALMMSIDRMSKEDDPLDLINTIHQQLQEGYGSNNLFDHIQSVAEGVIKSTHSTDEDIGYSLMASAYIKNIEGTHKDESIDEFASAGEYGIHQGYLEAGRLLEEKGDLEGAMGIYVTAYSTYPSKKIILYCIDIFLQLGNLSEANKLIQQAKMNGYQIGGYISAYYLYQGEYKQAFEELINIYRNGGEFIEFPDWYMKLLNDTLDKIISGPSESVDDTILILYASYLELGLFIPNNDLNSLERYIKHIGLIKGIITRFEYHETSVILNTFLPNIVGDIESEDDFDSLIIGLHLHFDRIFIKMEDHHRALQNGHDAENLSKSINYINTLAMTAIEILSLFSESDNYRDIWRNRILVYPEKFDPNTIIFDTPATLQ